MMIVQFKLSIYSLLLLIFFFPVSSYGVVAIENQANEITTNSNSKEIKKEPKETKKLPWKKILNYGLLPLLQVVSFLVLLSVGALAGAELVGAIFINVTVLLAAFTMRKKKKPMRIARVVISCLTIVVNLLVARWLNLVKD